MSRNSAKIVPARVVVIPRSSNGFGFTLRHFIAYPPGDGTSWQQEASDSSQTRSLRMETIFIKEVQPNGPAHYANLQTGDRILMVNNQPITECTYNSIVAIIKQTPKFLTLHVVPKECDVLQMHYTIAHTPESNRIAGVPRHIPSPVTVGNGNLAGALIPIAAAQTFPQQLISYPLGLQGSRSGSVTSTTSSSFHPVASGGSGSNSMDYGDMAHSLQQHGALLMRGDGGFMRSQPANLTVLSRHHHQQQQQQQLHQQQQQHNSTLYAPTAAETSEIIMIRLRESIKQKEEFLKSPLPHGTHQQQQQHQHFFPHTTPSSSPQLSTVSTSTASAGSSGARGQVRPLVKQPVSASSSTSSTRELLPASCDMHHFYARNMSGNFVPMEHVVQRGGGFTSTSARASANASDVGVHLQDDSAKVVTYTAVARSQRPGSNSASSSGGAVAVAAGDGTVSAAVASGSGESRDELTQDLEDLDPLQETGVTNQVFERKLVSNLARGFDPFKPLSINTSNAISAAAAAGNNVVAVKKPGVLYDSLQHHPLHQLQVQQLQQSQQPKVHHSSTNVVDGQQSSRMEIHKASLATTIDHLPSSSRYTSKLAEVEEKPTLANIAESSDVPSTKAASDCHIVRRYKPTSSLDDNKPMRRISYLRATNNEDVYQPDASPSKSAAAAAGVEAPQTPTKEQIDSDADPTYDVVAGDCVIDESPSGSEDPRGAAAVVTVTVNSASRRASVNSEARESVNFENLSADFNGKLEIKDLASEMEVFETEMEIKSSCINGKRISEYRSWRQAKIEIKGDILRIYSTRSSKSDTNVIELDIRNFQIFDESVDKKKYVFRMQSKPLHMVNVELHLDDGPDRLTSSGSSSSASALHADQHQHTEILFKTKSITEMKRIFGLLQWKNSFIYDDSDLHGKQLAEPQKTAATASMPTATYCDDNVQQQPQQHTQLLQLDYSPSSSTSRGEVEVSDSISPVMKARKSSSHKNIPDKDLGSPKSKNWKDLLFRRGGGSHNADISPSNLASTSRTTGSIGVQLKNCPKSTDNEYVPRIVDVCTNIVETKGLSVVGIYRIPGNKSAISDLAIEVNKSDFSWDSCETDVRWQDVNVVSSLLKQVIRSLPDGLLPGSFYDPFIEADKKTGLVRLREMKDLMESLPPHSYETMKHLIRHLHRISANCEVNLMEPKNLAIIFGPSIIRKPNDTLEIAVKDMRYQCRIVELLVTQYAYFFEKGTTPDIADVSGNMPDALASDATSAGAQSEAHQTNMLLDNVSKIERLTESSKTGFIHNFTRRGKRGAVSSDTYSGESALSLDYTKTTNTASSSSTNVTTASSSSSSSTNTTTTTTKKKERTFLSHGSRTHHRKTSLGDKDSGSGGSLGKEQQRSSVDISVLLTDDESGTSRISDTGSMSLTTITDTLDSKLRNLRSGSESNDENGSPEFPKNRRHTLGPALHIHSEHIPYADESPERYFHTSPLEASNAVMLSRSCTATNTLCTKTSIEHERDREQQRPIPPSALSYRNHKLLHSATVPINSASAGGGGLMSPPTTAPTPTAVVTVKTTTISGPGVSGSTRNSYAGGRNLRFSSSVYEQCCSEDDSEGSTTSDPKESLIIASPSFFLDRHNKKRRDHRLFRSASFNCRNYSTRHASNGGVYTPSALTKDEKTDMNLTKKRQIINKQNRSIKRRHTVGGPHDYATTGTVTANNCNHQCRGNGTTTTTTVLRRIPIPSAHSNISNNNNNNNNNNGNLQQNDNSNGNGGSSATVAVAGGGDHVLEHSLSNNTNFCVKNYRNC